MAGEEEWLHEGTADVAAPESAGADSAMLRERCARRGPKPVEEQAEDLDTWLKHARQHHAQPLMKAAAKWSERLEGELASLEGAMRQVRRRKASAVRRSSRSKSLLDSPTRCSGWTRGNLHDFRKGAKKARYMAEAGGDDREAGTVGKALKRLQDEIGDWHDWLVLAEEADHALGANGAELTALIEAQRDKHYAQALKTAERMRGRLLGELQALSQRRRTRVRGPQRAVTQQTKISEIFLVYRCSLMAKSSPEMYLS